MLHLLKPPPKPDRLKHFDRDGPVVRLLALFLCVLEQWGATLIVGFLTVGAIAMAYVGPAKVMAKLLGVI
jgi:hypothetical protein